MFSSIHLLRPPLGCSLLVGYGKVWRKGSKKGLLCGRDDICQKVEGRSWLRVLYLVCPFTLCPYLLSLKKWWLDWKKFKKNSCGEGSWRKSLIWLISRLCVWRSKMGGLKAFLSSIRHFWVNGLGDLWKKGTLFENG